jgi:large subunit ribosomal protein L17
MRHRKKIPLLARPADQRKAMLRSIVTAFFIHGAITTTHRRAKAVQPIVDKIINLAKRNDVHAIRQIARLIYNQYTGGMREDGNEGRLIRNTVLRIIVRDIAPKVQKRQSGYTRVVALPARRGDATPMGFLQLIEDTEVAPITVASAQDVQASAS